MTGFAIGDENKWRYTRPQCVAFACVAIVWSRFDEFCQQTLAQPLRGAHLNCGRCGCKGCGCARVIDLAKCVSSLACALFNKRRPTDWVGARQLAAGRDHADHVRHSMRALVLSGVCRTMCAAAAAATARERPSNWPVCSGRPTRVEFSIGLAWH